MKSLTETDKYQICDENAFCYGSDSITWYTYIDFSFFLHFIHYSYIFYVTSYLQIPIFKNALITLHMFPFKDENLQK